MQAGVARLGETNYEVVPELARIMGRSVRYGGGFGRLKERADHMASISKNALAPREIEASERFIRRIRREPQGVVFVIAPWNHPYTTAIKTVVPALIAGYAVLLNHATQTLLVGERMARLPQGRRAGRGLPERLPQSRRGRWPDRRPELRLRRLTGSVAGGRAIKRAAAGSFTALGLELGGNDPGYVLADADLGAAAATLLDGVMCKTGQCCCGIERIHVAAEVYDAFLEKAVAIAARLRLGRSLEPERTLGPMAHRRFADTVRMQIGEALEVGAVAHLEAQAADDGGAYLSPQILTNVSRHLRLMCEKSFGPIVGVMEVEIDEKTLRLMNDSAYGLTASLWTHDPERVEALGARIETGAVFMDRCDYLDPALCWTGCKDTGRGAALSDLGYDSVTRPKSYHLRLPE